MSEERKVEVTLAHPLVLFALFVWLVGDCGSHGSVYLAPKSETEQERDRLGAQVCMANNGAADPRCQGYFAR